MLQQCTKIIQSFNEVQNAKIIQQNMSKNEIYTLKVHNEINKNVCRKLSKINLYYIGKGREWVIRDWNYTSSPTCGRMWFKYGGNHEKPRGRPAPVKCHNQSQIQTDMTSCSICHWL